MENKMSENKEVNTSKDIENYEEYLSKFFSNLEQVKQETLTPEEIGMKMAEETLIHIQNLLVNNNKKDS